MLARLGDWTSVRASTQGPEPQHLDHDEVRPAPAPSGSWRRPGRPRPPRPRGHAQLCARVDGREVGGEGSDDLRQVVLIEVVQGEAVVQHARRFRHRISRAVSASTSSRDEAAVRGSREEGLEDAGAERSRAWSGRPRDRRARQRLYRRHPADVRNPDAKWARGRRTL